MRNKVLETLYEYSIGTSSMEELEETTLKYVEKNKYSVSKLSEMSVILYQKSVLETFDYDIEKIYQKGSKFDKVVMDSVLPYLFAIQNSSFKGGYKEWIENVVKESPSGKKEYESLENKEAYDKLITLIDKHLKHYPKKYNKKGEDK